MTLDIALPVPYDWVLLGSRLLVATLLLLFFWRVLVIVQREMTLQQSGSRQMMLGLLGTDDHTISAFRLSRRRSNSIGRDGTNDIVVTDRSVSGSHAMVQFTESEWVLTDLGSRNGTFLNGQPVVTPIQMREGDVVQCGAVRFLLAIDQSGF
jgi:pSer/pThr/pTyr-binding forkhead associated (FHA) protein